MIPITQTRVGQNGNCFNACIASILEISLSAVPEVPGDGYEFYDAVNRFLARYGLYYYVVGADDPDIEHVFRDGDTYHTVEGTSPRGGPHACVGLNGRIVHDPHPQDGTGRGLDVVENYGLFGSRMTTGVHRD